ncbi:Dienelactone hydrolase [Burkholderia sp. OK233]|nr:Dienelactone hydrolase [Burkholderia sp. OK233]
MLSQHCNLLEGDILGTQIRIGSNDGAGEFSGYLAIPASGNGPGIVLCQEIFGVNGTMRAVADYYAEEGYVVLVPDLFWRQEPNQEIAYDAAGFDRAMQFYRNFDEANGVEDVAAAVQTLRDRPECDGQVGVLGFCLGGKLAWLAACRLDELSAVVSYYGVGIEKALDEAAGIHCRVVLHIAGNDSLCPPVAREQIIGALQGQPHIEVYVYEGVDHAFARVGGHAFDKPSALRAHERSVAVFRRQMGPEFDLSALWEKHVEYEFVTRNVPATMATMVAQPYVNHIPTLTGGVGAHDLSRFYQDFFIPCNPPDSRFISVSRTVGATQIVDEMIFCFTHTCEMDYFLPGIAPTGRYVEVPMVAIVKFRGDKLYHEHIYWDQASVLVQIGLLDASTLPVAGIDTAKKLLDETIPSNTMMTHWHQV